MADAITVIDELERLTSDAFKSRHLRPEHYQRARALVGELKNCAIVHARDLPVDNIDEQIEELELRLRRLFGQEPSHHGVQQEYVWVLGQIGKLRQETCFGVRSSDTRSLSP